MQKRIIGYAKYAACVTCLRVTSLNVSTVSNHLSYPNVPKCYSARPIFPFKKKVRLIHPSKMDVLALGQTDKTTSTENVKKSCDSHTVTPNRFNFDNNNKKKKNDLSCLRLLQEMK